MCSMASHRLPNSHLRTNHSTTRRHQWWSFSAAGKLLTVYLPFARAAARFCPNLHARRPLAETQHQHPARLTIRLERDRGFADSPLEEGVSSEPVSARGSLVTG